MKKLLIIILLASVTSIGYSQPTADIAIENPRIVGSQFFFDVYFSRTNDHADWFFGGASPILGSCSWVFNYNNVDLTNLALLNVNPNVFDATNYTNAIASISGQIVITTTWSWVFMAPVPFLNLNEWYFVFTVRADILTATAQSLVSNDALNTGLLTHNGNSVTESYFDSDNNIALNTKSWTGAIDQDWDVPGNWSPAGVPVVTDDIIYPNNPTNPLGGFNTPPPPPERIINNLRINHLAQMIIPQSHGITVNGTTDLKGGNNLVISSVDGIFPLGGTASYIPMGAINYNAYALEAGHIEVQRYIDHEVNPGSYYHHQVAAPVGGAILDDWDIIPGATYAYEYQGLNIGQEWYNIYAPTRQTPAGYGFLLSSLNTTASHTASFYDNIVTAPTTVVTTDPGVYNLLGNPYPSPITWSTLYANNNTVVDAIYIWDPTNGNYITTTSAGGNPSADFIQLGQSFFVQTTIAPFTFSLGDRVHTVAPYMKDEYTNYMKVYTEGGNSTSDELYIRFIDAEVTGGYDENHDAIDWPSIYGELATEIYTVGTDNKNLTINARPLIGDDNVDIPLHFKAGVDAVYTLGTDFLDTFDPEVHIFLEDTHTPGLPWINLKEEGSYTFTASPEDDYGRFILHFYESAFGIDENGFDAITIYSSRTDAYIINKSEQLIKEIHVYDIMGNLLSRKAEVNAEITKMYVSDKSGYYVVKVITDKAVYSEKLLITK